MSEQNQPSASFKRPLEVEGADVNDTCSLQDVFDYEKESNEIASAVLGASDPTDCSYKNGYVYRQALYCCITCLTQKKSTLTPEQIEAKEFLHGICLACSYECHSNHELLELYTKRSFRCDCGNSKLPGTAKCKLVANKETTNSLNKYNHNFEGQYCNCNRPYPETDGKVDEANDDMIQCSICEDWHHQSHLKGGDKFPENEDDYEEMICQGCMSKNQFLWNYQGYISLKPTKDTTNADSTEEVNVENVAEDQAPKLTECFLKNHRLKNKNLKIEEMDQACCFLDGWREGLCKCSECLELYKKNDVEFLLNINDPISYYETLGKSKQTSEIDENQLIDAQLSKLNRTSRVEFLHGVNDFKTELTDFLAGFVNKGEVVKRENINAFFADLEKRKKRKLEDSKNATVDNFYCK